ncbi:hypothetical protein Trydic_g8010 [Trypoxylus dichotomus]
MSGVFGFSREAVRVKVKKCEGSLPPELRKFSVDPQITSFEVLQSILAKAFDLKGEFTICYKVEDVNNRETYLPLLSDWDLDAAFLKAHNLSTNNTEPCLCLQVDLKSFEECSDEWDIKSTVPMVTQFKSIGQESKSAPRLHGIFNQMGKTFNMVQRALNLGDEGNTSYQPPRPPLSDAEFRRFLDPVGQIIHSKELRYVIYFGGIDPSLRKVVWKHILNVYPDGMTGKERMDYIRKKAAEYIALKETWKAAIAAGPVVGELAYTTGMVRKDVLRTDRHHPFYAGSDDNQNIASLFNILTTYALNHPKVSYCQGMSDIASPLLVTMGDEAHAYICFCALMSRLSTNFMIDGIAMTQKFTHLAEGLQYYDPEFYTYLKSHQADDLLFCYRWLLLEMKREFAFDDSLRMLEVLWSSLPAEPPMKELKLYDVRFQLTQAITPPISPLVKTPRESPYTKVCALRRQSSSISLASYAGKKVPIVKRQNHSLDESIGRSRSNVFETKLKHQSLDDTSLLRRNNKLDSPPKSPKEIETNIGDHSKNNKHLKSSKSESRPRSVSPLEQKSDSVLLNNKINTQNVLSKSRSNSLSSSMTNLIKTSKRNGHFKDLKEKISGSKVGIFSSLDKLDTTHHNSKESLEKPRGKMLAKISNLSESDKPKITLTKSSFDDSESSSLERNSSHLEQTRYSSTSNEDTFDECSPDDSQEYFPMTTSVTRELKIELENLDRQVFGNKFNEKLVDSDSPSSDCKDSRSECNCVISKDTSELITTDTSTQVAELTSTPVLNLKLKEDSRDSDYEKRKSKGDDVFLWENPLHQSSPCIPKTIQTPDEQADLEYDSEMGIVDEISSSRMVTPIKILNSTHSIKTDTDIDSKINENCNESPKRVQDDLELIKSEMNVPQMTNSCEEVTETGKPNLLPPPAEFGGGNPFLMFLCITVLLQHRDHIISKGMDYNEMAMHFDKMVRKHNVTKVLNQARRMYARYTKQHTIAQQKIVNRNEDC